MGLDTASDEPEAKHVDPDSEPEPEQSTTWAKYRWIKLSSSRGVLPACFRDDISDDDGVLCELYQLNEPLGMAGDLCFGLTVIHVAHGCTTTEHSRRMLFLEDTNAKSVHNFDFYDVLPIIAIVQ